MTPIYFLEKVFESFRQALELQNAHSKKAIKSFYFPFMTLFLFPFK